MENGIWHRNFLYLKDIDIPHTQEVTTHCLEDSLGYITHYNKENEQRGTAIVLRDITLTNNDTHVDGAMAGWIDHVFLVDTYAHPGSIGGPKEKQSLIPR
jgi:hypothetical protein